MSIREDVGLERIPYTFDSVRYPNKFIPKSHNNIKITQQNKVEPLLNDERARCFN